MIPKKLVELVKLTLNDPWSIKEKWLRWRLDAAREAIKAKYGVDASEMIFHVMVDGYPDDKPSFARRVYHNYVGYLAAARVENASRVRLLLMAAGSGAILSLASSSTAIGSVMNYIGHEPGIITTSVLRFIQSVAGVFVVAALPITAAMTLGITKWAWLPVLPNVPVFTKDDLDQADTFVKDTMARAHIEAAPDDLKSETWRLFNFDAKGNPVDGQIVNSDFTNSWLWDSLRGMTAVTGLMTAAFVCATPGVLWVMLGGGSIAGLSALTAPIVSGFAVATAFLNLWLLPEQAVQRETEKLAAREESASARLAEQIGTPALVELEEARKAQEVNASRDHTAFFPLGVSTGVLAGRRDPFAPTEAGITMGLTVSDIATHMIVLGRTGAGKTSGALRPILQCWGTASAGGLLVLDGKGVLPAELTGYPGMVIIDPEKSKYNPIENLSPDEIADTFLKIFGGGADDPMWELSAAKLIRSAAAVLCYMSEHHGWDFNMANLYELATVDAARGRILEQLAVQEGELERLANLEGYQRRAFDYLMRDFPETTEKTKSSILNIARTWLASVVDHALLSGWADTTQGQQVEKVLQGHAIGLLLPEAKYGKAGALITVLAKSRLYRAVKQRGDVWKDDPSQTPVMLLADECQEIISDDELGMLPIARSLGLYCVFSTQNIEGIKAAIGHDDKAAQFLGNLSSVIALNVDTPASNAFVAARMGSAPRVVFAGIPAVRADSDSLVTELGWRTDGGMAGSAARRSDKIQGQRKHSGLGGHVTALWQKVGGPEVMQEIMHGASTGFRNQRQVPQVHTGILRLVEDNEVPALTTTPNSALVSFNRGRVPRRDLMRLQPIYEFTEGDFVRTIEAEVLDVPAQLITAEMTTEGVA